MTTDAGGIAYTPLTPLAFLGRSADVYPDKTAIVYAERRIRYRDFAAEATRLARALQALGVRPGNRVAYLCPNTPEMLTAHFGVPLAGAVLVAINTRLSAQEVEYICNHSGARLLIADAAFLALLRPVLACLETVEKIVVVTDPVASLPAAPVLANLGYAELLAAGSDEPLPWAVEDELATITINYTSGTTGQPKEVMYSHRGAYLNALGEIIHSRSGRKASTCGRCRCFTVMGGAPPGGSPASAPRTSAYAARGPT